MIRNAPRRRVLFALVIALVGMMVTPVDECDDYAFIHPRATTAQAGVPADDPAGSGAKGGEQPDHQQVCSCLVCVLTTNDAFVPRLPSPQRGDVVAAVSAVLSSSTYLPAIFHPPIA